MHHREVVPSIVRARRLIVAVVLCAYVAFRLPAQIAVERPRVLVVPLANLTGQGQNAIVADTSTDTVILTLRLLDRYDLLPYDDSIPPSERLIGATDDELAGVATEAGADNIVYGSLRIDEEGAFAFQLFVFDRAEGRIAVRAESASPTLFGVFDAADALVTEAVSGFSGIRIGFGALRVESEGEGDFVLVVDGSVIGDNVRTIDRLLIGERTVTIRQRRGTGEVAISSQEIRVSEGETAIVRFTFPRVTAEEEAREVELRSALADALALGVDPQGAVATIDELEALYARIPGAFPGSSEDIPFYNDRVRLARQMQRLARSGLFGPQTAVSDISWIGRMASEWDELFARYGREEDGATSSGFFSPGQRAERIRRDIHRNASAALALLTLRRAALTSRRDAATVARYDRTVQELRRAAAEYNWRPQSRWMAATIYARTSMRTYEGALERRTPAWHWIAAAMGAGALGYAAWTTDAIDSQEATIDEQIQNEYRTATSVAAIRESRASIEEDIDTLNFYETVRPAAVAAGGTLIATAVLGRILSVTRPRRVWRRYRDDPEIERRTAAGLEYEAALRRGDAVGVLVVGDGETFRIAGDRTVYTTPHFIPRTPGTFEIEHVTARRGGPDTISVAVDTELSLVYLGVER